MEHGGPREGAGRPKGSLNRASLEVRQRLESLGLDPVEAMARLALQQCPCPTCHGTGKARYSVGSSGPYLDPDHGSEMTCRTCLGTGREPVPLELRVRVLAELSHFVAPRLKSIEIAGPDGGGLPLETAPLDLKEAARQIAFVLAAAGQAEPEKGPDSG